MKKLTVRWLRSHTACSEAVERFSSQAESDPVRVISLLIDEGNFEWANWLIVRIMTRKQYLMYAIFSAESVLDIYERSYPQDNRVRLAIEAARVVCQNDCKKNRTAAWAAARAAIGDSWGAWVAGDVRGAAEAARAASWAAEASCAAGAAAWAAAARAAWVAWAAARVAWDADRDASETERSSIIRKQIINYGIKLLTGEEK